MSLEDIINALVARMTALVNSSSDTIFGDVGSELKATFEKYPALVVHEVDTFPELYTSDHDLHEYRIGLDCYIKITPGNKGTVSRSARRIFEAMRADLAGSDYLGLSRTILMPLGLVSSLDEVPAVGESLVMNTEVVAKVLTSV